MYNYPGFKISCGTLIQAWYFIWDSSKSLAGLVSIITIDDFSDVIKEWSSELEINNFSLSIKNKNEDIIVLT